jgi:hypothetical protein
MLITTFIAISSSNVGLLSQKALAQDNNKKAASTNNMTNIITTNIYGTRKNIKESLCRLFANGHINKILMKIIS